MDNISGEGRAALIQGLIDAATFLATHPDVPVDYFAPTIVWHFAQDPDPEAARREVDEAARLAGVATSGKDGVNYSASRWFGPVEYRSVAVPRRGEAQTAPLAAVQAQTAAAA